MSDISKLSRVIDGVIRNVDISTNTLVVDKVKFGGGAGTDLSKTILDKLINLQNGTDFADGTNSHTHDGRYFTESELGSSNASSGSDLIGDDNTYTNFTPTAATVKGALQGINTALGAGSNDKQVRVSAADTTSDYLSPKIQVDVGSNTTNALEESILNPAGNEIFRIRFDASKVSHSALLNLSSDDHTQYILVDGTRAFSGNQSMGGNKLTNLAPASANGDAVRWEQLQNALSLIQNFEFQNSAIDYIVDNTVAPPTEVLGDRYVLSHDGGTPHVDWDGAEAGDIVEFNGTLWVETNPTVGMMISIDDETSSLRQWGGSSWVQKYFEATTASTGLTKVGFDVRLDASAAGDGLAFSAGILSVKLEASNPSLQISSDELGIKFDPAGALSKGAAGTKANVDNSTIEIATNALQVKDLGISTAKLAATSVTAAKLGSDVAGSGLTGGNGAAIDVNPGDGIEINSDAVRVKLDGDSISRSASGVKTAHAPLAKKVMVAGESMAANTSFLVRFALNGETAGRVYKADKDASVSDKFHAIGIALSTSAVSAGENIDVIMLGTHVLGSSDTPFAGADIGKPVFLGSSGAFILGASLTNTANEAAKPIGFVENTDRIFVQPMIGIVA